MHSTDHTVIASLANTDVIQLLTSLECGCLLTAITIALLWLRWDGEGVGVALFCCS
jgi:hypothetical protein